MASEGRRPRWIWSALFGPLSLAFLAACAYRIAARHSSDPWLELWPIMLLPTFVLQAVLLVPFGLRWLKPMAGRSYLVVSIVAIGLALGSIGLLLASIPNEIIERYERG